MEHVTQVTFTRFRLVTVRQTDHYGTYRAIVASRVKSVYWTTRKYAKSQTRQIAD